MALEAFIEKRFNRSSLIIIQQANQIIDEFMKDGFTLTLRQLYYQFVTLNLIENKQSEYKRLGSIINDARLAGYIDWDAIEDRTRNVRSIGMWVNPIDVLQAVANQYRENPWLDQEYQPAVWIEKDALVGVIAGVCNKFQIPYFACRGYTSQSEVYAAGQNFAAIRESGREPIVFHLGDHDPSGLDMTRDNHDRLAMFAYDEVEVIRLALNWDQVQQYNPPPNPAKDTDARFKDYKRKYGPSSWELDSLNPRVINTLIESHLAKLIEPNAWHESITRQNNNRKSLDKLAKNWHKVETFLQGV